MKKYVEMVGENVVEDGQESSILSPDDSIKKDVETS